MIALAGAALLSLGAGCEQELRKSERAEPAAAAPPTAPPADPPPAGAEPAPQITTGPGRAGGDAPTRIDAGVSDGGTIDAARSDAAAADAASPDAASPTRDAGAAGAAVTACFEKCRVALEGCMAKLMAPDAGIPDPARCSTSFEQCKGACGK